MSNQPIQQSIKTLTTVCCGCGLLCDDVSAEVTASQTVATSGWCEKGKRWLSNAANSSSLTAIDGLPAELSRTIDRARDLLFQARNPLIVGLDQLSLSAQSLAVKLARSLRGSIDVSFSPLSSFEFALQKIGRVTATLGEVRDRSDVIIFWATDPMRTHPRLLERVGAKNKTLYFVGGVGEPQLPDSPMAHRLPGPGRRDDLVELLRSDSADAKVNLGENAIAAATLDFIETVRRAKHLTIFTDPAQFPGYYSAFGLHQLVRERNDNARAVLLPLQNAQQAMMAENCLTANFGFARAVDLTLGFPRCNWDEFAAHRLLENRIPDCVLWICDEEAVAVNRRIESAPSINWIVLNSNASVAPVNAKIQVRIKKLGLEESGDATRFDDLTIPVDQIYDSPACSAGEFLMRLLNSSSTGNSEA